MMNDASLRTTIHNSAKYTQLETVRVADMKAIMFRQTLQRRPDLCRDFCFQKEMAGEGRLKRDVMRIGRKKKEQCENNAEAKKEKGVSGSFFSWCGVVAAPVWEAVRLIVIAVNEKSSTCVEDEPHCSSFHSGASHVA